MRKAGAKRCCWCCHFSYMVMLRIANILLSTKMVWRATKWPLFDLQRQRHSRCFGSGFCISTKCCVFLKVLCLWSDNCAIRKNNMISDAAENKKILDGLIMEIGNFKRKLSYRNEWHWRRAKKKWNRVFVRWIIIQCLTLEAWLTYGRFWLM